MKRIVAASVIVAALAFAHSAKADQVTIDVSIECTTPGTSVTGERHDCTTAESRQTAPENYVIAENSIQIDNHGRGSYHDCYSHYADYVEIIPGSGLKQPKTILYSAKAMSPSGHSSGSGDVTCHITGFYTKYK